MKINLLDYGFFRFIFQNKYFTNVLRLFVLVVFVYAIAYGFYDNSENNRVTGGIFWNLFWPFFMVLMLVTFGRFFCSICPLAFVGKKLNRIGSRKTIPPFLKNPFVGIFFLIVGFWLVYYIFPGFLKSPVASATFFLFFSLLSLWFFYRYKNMAYCKSVCPVSSVTRAFGKVGFTWMTTDATRCADCKTFECAKACDWHLQPFQFDKKNTMADCTLCMDCTRACDAVEFEIKQPSYAANLNFIPQKFEVWAILLVTAAITVTMNFHHALGRVAISDTYPWARSAQWLQSVIALPQGIDAVGLMAFIYALAVTIMLATGGMWIASKIMRLPYGKVFYTLSYAFAPIFIVGGLSHLFEFFFYNYASNVSNAFIQMLHLNIPYMKPLASRSDAWVHMFGFFKHLAVLWALYILYRRFAHLDAPTIRKWLAAPFAAALIAFYLGAGFYAGYALKTYGTKQHQHQAAVTQPVTQTSGHGTH
ncbi:MAG: 4Fe-4S binding protein [Neisseria sp.]|nr:4Fe-4S binding protein [Neisseria sp.]